MPTRTDYRDADAPPAEMTTKEAGPPRRRRWRHYETAAGNRPVLDFIRKAPEEDKAAILAAMKEVRQSGVQVARRLSGEIFEVRADGERVIYRVLFAREGSHSQVLLSLVAFNKKTQKTPPDEIRLAQRRLRDWRSRRRKV
jgi:phage-related protein